jgi:hypothetical protein
MRLPGRNRQASGEGFDASADVSMRPRHVECDVANSTLLTVWD